MPNTATPTLITAVMLNQPTLHDLLLQHPQQLPTQDGSSLGAHTGARQVYRSSTASTILDGIDKLNKNLPLEIEWVGRILRCYPAPLPLFP